MLHGQVHEVSRVAHHKTCSASGCDQRTLSHGLDMQVILSVHDRA